MLFVSRYIWRDCFGLVNSETGVEIVADCDMIESFIQNCLIAGVSVQEDRRKLFRTLEIMPYQPVETVTSLQTKTSVLLHTDVIVYDGAIVSIAWSRDKITAPVHIRLSDFGHKLDDCLFLCNLPSIESPKVICHLDDGITEISEHALSMNASFNTPSLAVIGVVFDMSEMSDGVLVDRLYQTLFCPSILANTDDPTELVIDNEDRLNRMKSKYLI